MLNEIKKYYVEPLRRDSISIYQENGRKIFKIENLPVLKRRMGRMTDRAGNTVGSYIMRSVKLPYEPYQELIYFIEKYLERLPDDPNTVVFPMARSTAWSMINREFELFCHFFRHCRATDLHKLIRQPIAVKRFFQWTKMQERYAHYIDDDIFTLIENRLKESE